MTASIPNLVLGWERDRARLDPGFVTAVSPISSHTIFAQGVGPLKPDTVGPTNLDKLTRKNPGIDAGAVGL